MLMIVLGGVIFVAVGVWFAYEIDSISGGIIIGLMMGGGVFGVGTMIASNADYDNQPRNLDSSSNLKAIGADSNATGSFFLATGSIDEEPVYYYYYETNGGFKLDKIEAEDVTIIESNETPRIEEYGTTTDKSWLYYGGWKSEYKIYVPAGSVTNDMNISLPS